MQVGAAVLGVPSKATIKEVHSLCTCFHIQFGIVYVLVLHFLMSIKIDLFLLLIPWMCSEQYYLWKQMVLMIWKLIPLCVCRQIANLLWLELWTAKHFGKCKPLRFAVERDYIIFSFLIHNIIFSFSIHTLLFSILDVLFCNFSKSFVAGD